ASATIFEQFTAQAIDRLSLTIHHIVVFEQMFADREIVRFNRLLRRLYTLAHKPALYSHALLHTKREHQVLHTLATEDAHQIVFERKVEARRARISLAACTTTQLIIDAAGFVSLCADYVKAAQANHIDVLGVSYLFSPLKSRFKLFWCCFFRVDLIF